VPFTRVNRAYTYHFVKEEFGTIALGTTKPTDDRAFIQSVPIRIVETDGGCCRQSLW
jgi:hypothetical protein